MQRLGILLASSAVATLALSSAALAGGFQRGAADTDILFERGTFSMRYGLTHVSPQRGFDSIEGRSGDYGEYTESYTIPSLAVAFGTDPFACAGTYTESFAAEADYSGSPGGALPFSVSSATSTSRTVGTSFESDEFGATCRASYSFANDHRVSLLGGLFVEDFDFDGESQGQRNLNSDLAALGLGPILAATGSTVLLPSDVRAESEGGFQTGFRLGAAYEIPDIAFRAQVLYRSDVEHDNIEGDGSVTISDAAFVRLADGSTASIPTVFGPGLGGVIAARIPAAGTVIPVSSSLSDTISPQSLNINVQTGIAPGTLLLASFRWTDWSTNDTVVSSITGPGIESSSISPYNWRDGYTASIGVGRAFNERISGAVSLGYDRGVSTGAETTYTDLYTVSAGVALKPEAWSEIRVGGLVGYWTDGEQSEDDGAYFDATVGDDIVVGGSASIKFTF